ncbi:MAG: hypothetical protein JW384_03157 [Nitrosomonadaceae bacterium]|nr:hypothetical protein [Nitrosomonadaceae bacterium]
MGRGVYRAGLGALLTSDQLATTLPVSIYRLVTGTAWVSFPNSDRSHPSSFVMVQGRDYQEGLPIAVNGLQWEQVAVPVLLDPRVSGWIGVIRSSGQPVYLSNSVIGPNGQVALTSSGVPLSEGALIGAASIRSGVQPAILLNTHEYLRSLQDLVRIAAVNAGY